MFIVYILRSFARIDSSGKFTFSISFSAVELRPHLIKICLIFRYPDQSTNHSYRPLGDSFQRLEFLYFECQFILFTGKIPINPTS